ncbi:MAG: hypothetical protein GX893_05700 [Firmicutes bacterium]|nr:hypothetical protein [Bacillota bacterium]
MRKSREIIGLPVIDLQEGSSLGRVVGLLINPVKRQVEALEVGERNLLNTKTKTLPFTWLYSIGNDAVTVTTADSMQGTQNTPENIIPSESLLKTQVVTVDGSFIGSIKEFSFNPEDGTLQEIFLVAEKSHLQLALPVTAVKTFGRDFLLVNEDYSANTRQVEQTTNNFNAHSFVKSLESKAVDFALGREVKQDVIDDEGNFIIQKGEKVTNKTIANARSKGRLPQLLFAAGVGELLEGIDFTREKLDAGNKKLMEAWHKFRGRSQEWLNRKLDDDMNETTAELRELWLQIHEKLIQGGREIEDATRERIRSYVLGKKMANPVFDQDGALLGGRGDLVTEELINKAEAVGRLPQLFLSVSTGEVQRTIRPLIGQIRAILGEK